MLLLLHVSKPAPGQYNVTGTAFKQMATTLNSNGISNLLPADLIQYYYCAIYVSMYMHVCICTYTYTAL